MGCEGRGLASSFQTGPGQHQITPPVPVESEEPILVLLLKMTWQLGLLILGLTTVLYSDLVGSAWSGRERRKIHTISRQTTVYLAFDGE